MTRLSGPELARKLSPHFPVGACTQKRSGEYAGCHVIDFYYPGWDKPVSPAEQLASELVSHLGGSIRIVKTYQQEKSYVDDPFVMCATVILRMDAVATIPIPRIHLLPAPAIAGYLTAGQVAVVVTRYSIGEVIVIPGTQRKATILEIDTNKPEPFYRVALMDGLAHKWYPQSRIAAWNTRIEDVQFVVWSTGKAA